MTKRSVSELKSTFRNGAKPTEEDFGDVFDSMLHKDDPITKGVQLADETQVKYGDQSVAISARDSRLELAKLKDEVDQEVDVIEKEVDATEKALDAHSNNRNNPHLVTKAQVGLGRLPNAISDLFTLNSSKSLATSKAVYDLYIRNRIYIRETGNVYVGDLVTDGFFTITHNLGTTLYNVIGILFVNDDTDAKANKNNDVSFVVYNRQVNNFKIAIREYSQSRQNLSFMYIIVSY